MTMVKSLVALATERMLLKTSGQNFLKGIEFMYASGLAPDRLSVMMTTSNKFVLQFHSRCDVRPFAANYPNFARVLRGIVHVRAWNIRSIEFVNVAFHMQDVENLERTIEKLGVELVLLRNCSYPGVSRGEEAVRFLTALNRHKQAVVCEYGDDRLKNRITRATVHRRRERNNQPEEPRLDGQPPADANVAPDAAVRAVVRENQMMEMQERARRNVRGAAHPHRFPVVVPARGRNAAGDPLLMDRRRAVRVPRDILAGENPPADVDAPGLHGAVDPPVAAARPVPFRLIMPPDIDPPAAPPPRAPAPVPPADDALAPAMDHIREIVRNIERICPQAVPPNFLESMAQQEADAPANSPPPRLPQVREPAAGDALPAVPDAVELANQLRGLRDAVADVRRRQAFMQDNLAQPMPRAGGDRRDFYRFNVPGVPFHDFAQAARARLMDPMIVGRRARVQVPLRMLGRNPRARIEPPRLPERRPRVPDPPVGDDVPEIGQVEQMDDMVDNE